MYKVEIVSRKSLENQEYEEIPKDLLELVEDVLLNRREDATERLINFAEQVKGKGKEGQIKEELE